jgi:hypothetical protein
MGLARYPLDHRCRATRCDLAHHLAGVGTAGVPPSTLAELERMPALIDVYDEHGYDVEGRLALVRHKREDLLGALEQLDAGLAHDLAEVPELPSNVARSLVYVKE